MTSVTTSWHYPSSVDSPVKRSNDDYNWKSLGNLKKNDGVAPIKITSKSGSYAQPPYIVAKNYGFHIPSYADITKVEVQIAHKKITYSSSTAYPSIGKPSVGLYNVSDPGATLAAPTKSMASTKTTFSITPTVASVNNSAFGVKLTYPANTNTNTGDLQLKYIAVRVTYTVPRFSLAVARKDNIVKKVNDTIDINLTINNLDKTSYVPSVTISLSSGVSFNSKISGSGTVTSSGNSVTWKPSLSKSVSSASCVIRLNLTSEGTKTVSLNTTIPSRTDPTASAVSYTASTSFIVSNQSMDILDPTLSSDSLSLDLPKRMRVGDSKDLEIKFKSNTSFENNDEIILSVNGNGSITNPQMSEGTVTKDGDSYCIVPNLDNLNASDTFSFTLNASNQGELIIEAYYNDEIIFSKSILVILNSNLAFNYVEMTGEQLNRMSEGIEYTATSFIRINVPTENESELSDLGGNFRFGLFNDEIPSDETIETYIFDNAIWSDMPSEFNDFTEESLKFNYQSDCPIYFLWTSDYLVDGYDQVTVDFTNPVIIESEEREDVESVGLFPIPIQEIVHSETVSQISLDSGETTNELRCFNFDCEDFTDENIVIQGVELDVDVTTLDGECTVFAKLISPTLIDGKRSVGERSIILNDNENPHIHIGGKFDLWGLKFKDFEDFSQFRLDLQFVNPYSGSQMVEFNNVVLTVHYTVIEESKIKCYVNGEDTRFYNMFVKNVDIPMGIETDTQYMGIQGTDTTNAYRMNIDKKEIKIDFRVKGCTVEETTKLMERIAKLFTNPRDSLNRPTTNILEFSHYPNKYWEVIMENPIDNDVEFVEYEGTIKLVVPAGTGYNVESTTTSAIGTNAGIAKVNPLIQISPNQSNITLLEEYTNQKFIINESDVDIEGFTGFNEKDIIRIDCENRKVYYYPLNDEDTMDSLIEEEHEHLDITHAVDFNSNWFVIYEDYKFTSDNTCDIHFVEFFERW